MLYPLLSLDRWGSHSEHTDLLLRNAPVRNIRAKSEAGGLRAGARTPGRLSTPAVSHYPPNDFGVTREYCDTEYNSCAPRGNVPVLWGKSSSYINRSKYFPTTPKFRTEYPRFHTGFRFVPIFGQK